MAKVKVIAKPICSFKFTSDQIEGVCFSIGELLIFHLTENISSVSELGSKSWSSGPKSYAVPLLSFCYFAELEKTKQYKTKQTNKHKYSNQWQRKDHSNFFPILYWFISNVSAYSSIAYVAKPLRGDFKTQPQVDRRFRQVPAVVIL